MNVTAQEEYGVRCLLQLARERAQGRGGLSVDEIAERECSTPRYVRKLLGLLKTGGFVERERGGRRLYTLTRDPAAIMLDEALTVLGGRLFSGEQCAKGGPGARECVHMTACHVRPIWGQLELVASAILRRISLADLLGSESDIRAVFARSLQRSLRDGAGPFAPGEPGHPER